ncbi:unnamed protein product [Rotaria sordida]|uniref:Uncharacterized protein n=1 Tax=Rotaria sordida TaxID=392033 RepID=A0A816EFW9_9BILA|nr:unnamed protein product [Rotaria sordida]CAF1649206.1 unnamed protein product [Rotaria sordida]
MPSRIRSKKNTIDLRPIPIRGPKNDSYQWKLIALLELNEKGQFILPFSRRMVHIDCFLWPRSDPNLPLPGYRECGCIDCENKTCLDHILQDDDDDIESPYGNLHLEEISIRSDEKNNSDDSHSSKDDNDNDDNNISESLSSSISFNQFNINNDEDNDDSNEKEYYNDDNNELSSSRELPTISTATSPFLCDPYESYDWEC